MISPWKSMAKHGETMGKYGRIWKEHRKHIGRNGETWENIGFHDLSSFEMFNHQTCGDINGYEP